MRLLNRLLVLGGVRGLGRQARVRLVLRGDVRLRLRGRLGVRGKP
ncbi:hypothetical protein ACFQ51_30235 [Streptomyces kaempferi]